MDDLFKEVIRLGFKEDISYDNYSRFSNDLGRLLFLEEKLILLNREGEVVWEDKLPEVEQIEEILEALKDG